MRFMSLTLEGFRHYKEREELEELDLIDLGVIGGPNGSGKSTLFDAIEFALYGASRTTATGVISRGRKRAEVELIFRTENGGEYKIRRIRTDKSYEVYFYEKKDGEWNPIAEKNATAADAEILRVIGTDQETARATWYIHQDSSQTLTKEQPANRARFLEKTFIGDTYKVLHRKAKIHVKLLAPKMSRLSATHEALLARRTELKESKILPINGVEYSDDEIIENLKKIDKEDTRITMELSRNLSDKDVLQENKKAALEEMRSFLEAHNSKVTLHEQGLTAYQQNVNQANTDLNTAKNMHQDKQRIVENITASIRRSESQIAYLQSQVAESEEASFSIEDFTEDLANADNNITAKQDAVETIEGAIESLNTSLGALRQANSALDATRKGEEKQNAVVSDRREALNKSDGKKCYACNQELTPEHIEEMNKNFDGEEAQHRKNWSEANATIKSNISEMENLSQKIAENQQKLQQARLAERQAHNARADIERGLKEAQGIAALLEERQVALNTEKENLISVTSSLSAANSEVEKAEKTIRECKRALADAQNLFSQKSAEPAPELDKAKESAIAAKIQKANKDLTDSENAAEAREKLREERNILRNEQRLYWNEQNRRIENAQELESNKAQIVESQKAVDECQRKINHYKTLQEAFDITGIPAMIIAGIIDELNMHANEILSDLGATYGLEISSTKENKNGQVQDKIMINTTTAEGKDTYESLSGSEKYRCDLAIRIALIRAIAARTGNPIRTLLIDEGWGKLDEDIKRLMIEMLFKLTQIGYSVLTISHDETIKTSFPHSLAVDYSTGTARVTVN